jgi:hypothetical protein
VTPAQYWHDPTQHQLYVTGQLLSSLENITRKISVFRIPSGFNADPDLAFYINAGRVSDPGSKTNADPDSDQTLPSQKVSILQKAGNQVYLLIFVNFLAPGSGSAFPIRIRIQQS